MTLRRIGSRSGRDLKKMKRLLVVLWITMFLIDVALLNGQTATESPANKWFEKSQQRLLERNEQTAAALRTITNEKARIFLYSLDPNNPKGYATNTGTVFHGFPILGEVEVKNATDRVALIDSLVKGIEKSDGTVALCFNPRHGLRVMTNSRQFDVSICFECFRIHTYNFNGPREITTTSDPNKLYDSLLDKYHLQRSKD